MAQVPEPLILASGSIYRRQLLARLGIPFECRTTTVDEAPKQGETAEQLAQRLAVAKAEHVAGQLQRGLVVGSDQVAELAGRLLGKPGERAAARQQLLACAGKTVRFFTAVCLVNAASGIQRVHLDTTSVKFRELDDQIVDRYLDSEPALDCAGGFKAEGLGISLFDAIDNSDPTALVGLPLIALAGLLRAEGFDLP